MARKATDLLDVFRLGGQASESERAEDAPKRRERGERKARARREPRRESSEPVLSLTRRQVVLAGSALGLLLVLGFTLGLATGRAGGGDRAEPALQRTTGSAYWIQGRIDAMDMVNLRPVDSHEVLRDLVLRFGLPKDGVRILPEKTDLVIEIGPFASLERAQAYAKANRLDLINVRSSAPFRWPRFVEK